MDIFEDYDAISQCNKCGFCQVSCPVFRSTGHESGVARGRLALMRGIIEGLSDDYPIWANKVHKHRPVFCKGDETLVMFRKWVRQFYTDQKESP